jgi:hypothetical protein
LVQRREGVGGSLRGLGTDVVLLQGVVAVHALRGIEQAT